MYSNKQIFQDGMEQVKVSCVIPTYKRSDMLLRAVNSALAQSHRNIEVIVVDDNTPNDDFSIEVQKKLDTIIDSRLKYVQQAVHVNGAVARNVGIRESTGQFVAFLDDDDEWLPEKIEKQLDLLKKNEECAGCSCLYAFFRGGIEQKRCKPYSGENLLFDILCRKVRMFTSTVMVDAEVLMKNAMFDPELLRHQDLQMLADFASKASFCVLCSMEVKIHQDSDINRPNLEKFANAKQLYLSKMQRHIALFPVKEQKRIYAAHNFELFVAAIKEKKYSSALKYFGQIGFNGKAYLDFYEKYIKK